MKPANQTLAILLFTLIVASSLSDIVDCDESKSAPSLGSPPSPRKLPKDPLYISDVDLENLYDQWEEKDPEKLPPDELEPFKRPQPKMQFKNEEERKRMFDDPEKLMIASKKGKTTMMFVKIDNQTNSDRIEELTQRWQMGLANNHIKTERYVIAEDRSIFVFHDGYYAYDSREFFLEQPEIVEISIDNRVYHGKAYPVEYPNADKKKSSEKGKRDEL